MRAASERLPVVTTAAETAAMASIDKVNLRMISSSRLTVPEGRRLRGRRACAPQPAFPQAILLNAPEMR
jgi:hypothetical protein